jgi:hypothetical protein
VRKWPLFVEHQGLKTTNYLARPSRNEEIQPLISLILRISRIRIAGEMATR